MQEENYRIYMCIRPTASGEEWIFKRIMTRSLRSARALVGALSIELRGKMLFVAQPSGLPYTQMSFTKVLTPTGWQGLSEPKPISPWVVGTLIERLNPKGVPDSDSE